MYIGGRASGYVYRGRASGYVYSIWKEECQGMYMEGRVSGHV